MNEEEVDGHPAVIAFRMGLVESEVKSLGLKMDQIMTLYPTEARVLSMIKPVEDDIKELKRKKELEQQAKISLRGQFKIALLAAVASPLVTLIITLTMRQ